MSLNCRVNGANLRSKVQRDFDENSKEQRTNFVEIRSHYFCTVLYKEDSDLENGHLSREFVRHIICGENKFRQPILRGNREILKPAEKPAAPSKPVEITESQPSGHDNSPQTTVLEQRPISKPPPFPVV